MYYDYETDTTLPLLCTGVTSLIQRCLHVKWLRHLYNVISMYYDYETDTKLSLCTGVTSLQQRYLHI